MATMINELESLCQKLPAEKQAELVNFARFLWQQESRELAQSPETGDVAWERIINDPTPRPKLDTFIREALAEGEAELLDPDTL